MIMTNTKLRSYEVYSYNRDKALHDIGIEAHFGEKARWRPTHRGHRNLALKRRETGKHENTLKELVVPSCPNPFSEQTEGRTIFAEHSQLRVCR